MIVIPAVDIMEGKVVRLTRGDPSIKKDYDRLGDPVSVARLWEEQGAEWVHVIDLDAALSRGRNTATIMEILKETDAPCQVGGGIRSVDAAVRMLEAGVGRIIIGSMAIRSPETVERLIGEYGSERIVVSLDHDGGKILINGWETGSGMDLERALTKFKDLDIHRFLITGVDRDGTLSGPDVVVFRKVAGKARVIAAGGIGSLGDILDLQETGVEAAVVGRALYEGRFTLPQAISSVIGGEMNGLG
jgi:phosphoribosylformimino-5-aminoimidazole carboxamide ribotide isomerase